MDIKTLKELKKNLEDYALKQYMEEWNEDEKLTLRGKSILQKTCKKDSIGNSVNQNIFKRFGKRSPTKRRQQIEHFDMKICNIFHQLKLQVKSEKMIEL